MTSDYERWTRYLDYGGPPPVPPPPSPFDSLPKFDLLRNLPVAPQPDPRPKVFVSYHHKRDQGWCDLFRNTFSKDLRVFTDRSLSARVRSDDPEYVNRVIREDRIVGSSVTVVLCGPETWKRKYVDWEIRSTLHHEKGLLGIVLPTATRDAQGSRLIPDRLFDNWRSSFAHVIEWTSDPEAVRGALREARRRARTSSNLIDNSRAKMARNLS